MRPIRGIISLTLHPLLVPYISTVYVLVVCINYHHNFIITYKFVYVKIVAPLQDIKVYVHTV